MPRAAILLAFLLIHLHPAPAQEPGAHIGQKSPSAVSLFPHTRWSFMPSGGQDTAGSRIIQPDSGASPRGKKSSWTAVGLSAVLPGAGQVYTENYWKVPIILGLGGYWVYEWTRNNDRYAEFRDLFSQSVRDLPPYGDERYLRLREFYKDQRDSFTWYLGILYLLNVVDAYVGAELYDFDVGPELGAAGAGGMHASFTIRF